MAVFAIADLHLSFGVDKPMDVFKGWEGYTEKLAEHWHRLVAPEDTVVIGGDVSWGMNLKEAFKDLQFIHELPGKKLILKGNHDYWWSTKKKIEGFFQENGFDDLRIMHNCAYEADGLVLFGTRGWLYNAKTAEDVKIVNREAGRLRLSLDAAQKLQGKPVAFLHYPPLYDGAQATEILEILVQSGVTDCYYGHVHGTLAAKRAPTGRYRSGDREIQMHLVSCDYVNFTPIRIGGD